MELPADFQCEELIKHTYSQQNIISYLFTKYHPWWEFSLKGYFVLPDMAKFCTFTLSQSLLSAWFQRAFIYPVPRKRRHLSSASCVGPLYPQPTYQINYHLKAKRRRRTYYGLNQIPTFFSANGLLPDNHIRLWCFYQRALPCIEKPRGSTGASEHCQLELEICQLHDIWDAGEQKGLSVQMRFFFLYALASFSLSRKEGVTT